MWACGKAWLMMVKHTAVAGVVLGTALSQPGMEQQARLRLCGKESFRILPEGSFTKKAEASDGQHSGGI